MNNATLPPTLIRANIALFNGDRTEALRLLEEFRAEHISPGSYTGMMIWLQAQAQIDHDAKIRLLYSLVNTVAVDDYYGQLAREYLETENTYANLLQPPRQSNRGLILAVIGGIAAILIVVGVIVLPGRFEQPATLEESLATEISGAIPGLATPTIPSDNSRALVAEDSFTARYPAGILQLKAFEDRSERVLSLDSNTIIAPVPGARFYALEINFECRSGICDAPPQAELALLLDDESLLSVREDVQIAGESAPQPIALGRATTGWVVFEVPLLNRVDALQITPRPTESEEFEPIIIELPPW